MITSLEDKKWGIGCLSSKDQSFKEFIDQLQLINIIPSEGIYTWSNRRGGRHYIAKWLYRFLVSEPFFQHKQVVGGENRPIYGSDHWPISLRWMNGLGP
jgi:hypothetical protein